MPVHLICGIAAITAFSYYFQVRDTGFGQYFTV